MVGVLTGTVATLVKPLAEKLPLGSTPAVTRHDQQDHDQWNVKYLHGVYSFVFIDAVFPC